MNCVAEEQFVEMLDRGGLDEARAEERAHLEACGACRQTWATLAAAGEVLSGARSRSGKGWRTVPLVAAAAMLLGVLAVVVVRSAPLLRPSDEVPRETLSPEDAVKLFVDGSQEQSAWARERLLEGGRSVIATLVRARPGYRGRARFAALQDLIYRLKAATWGEEVEPEFLAILRKLDEMKLDLSLQQSRLQDVLSAVREISGLNIVGDPTLAVDVGAQRLDLDAKGETLRYVLDLICTVTGLDYDVRYGVLWIGGPEQLWPAQGLARLENAWVGQDLNLQDKETAGKLRAIRITVDMQNAPLSALVDYLREISGLTLTLQPPAGDAALSIKAQDVRFRHVLEMITLPFGLDARIENGSVLIGK